MWFITFMKRDLTTGSLLTYKKWEKFPKSSRWKIYLFTSFTDQQFSKCGKGKSLFFVWRLLPIITCSIHVTSRIRDQMKKKSRFVQVLVPIFTSKSLSQASNVIQNAIQKPTGRRKTLSSTVWEVLVKSFVRKESGQTPRHFTHDASVSLKICLNLKRTH